MSQPFGGPDSAAAASMINQGGLPVGAYDTYEAAQRAVDYLSDNEFPVQNLTIVGTDLRQVERVTGRLTQARVLVAGAVGGAWWGLFVALVIGIFTPDANWLLVVLWGLGVGAIFGLLMGWAGYAATGGRRDFTSTTALVADHYEVLCVAKHAEQARSLLAKLALATD